MAATWYEKPMRIAALQCNYEHGKTLQVADRWAQIGFNVEQLFHPMADGYSALFDVDKHGAILAAYLERARTLGLRIIVYLNVHILGPSQNGHRDEWAQRSADGGYPRFYDTYYACCVNSPWREHFFRVLGDLATYDIDGVFLDGPAIVPGGCHCPSCAERYRQRQGGELAAATDRSRFYQESKDDFLNEAYRRFKADHPQSAFYMNLPILHPSQSYVSPLAALAYNDIVGTEGGFMFYGPPKNGYLWRPSVAAKLLEAVAPHKPRVVFMAADQKSWSWYPHTPAETRLCIASSIANGANIWYGLHGSTRLLDTPGGRAGSEMIRFLADHEAVLEATESAARVAVLYSFDTERSYRTRAEESDFYGREGAKEGFWGNYSDAFQGFCDALARSSIAYDLITDLDLSPERLARHDCLLLPTCACLSDGTVAALRDYVAHGGNLVATFDTSLYTAEGEQRQDFALGDLFGVSFLGRPIAYRDYNYFSASLSHRLFAGIESPLLPAPATGLDVQEQGSAQVLARFHGVMAGRYVDLTPPEKPAIVLNRFGRGQCLYLAGTFAEMSLSYSPLEYRRLLQNACALFARHPLRLEGPAGNIELVVRRQGVRLIVHLVNYAGLPPRPFERVLPQRGLRLRLPAGGGYARAQALVAGSPCQCTAGPGGELLVQLPELHEHEIIVIEPAVV